MSQSSTDELLRDWAMIMSEKNGEDYRYSAELRNLARRSIVAITTAMVTEATLATDQPLDVHDYVSQWWKENGDEVRRRLEQRGHM